MLSIKCPECDGFDFRYKSDRSGNVRRYSCSNCGSIFIATIKGLPSDTVFSEKMNLSMQDLEWVKVMTDEKTA